MMLQHLLSAAVVIGALRVNMIFDYGIFQVR